MEINVCRDIGHWVKSEILQELEKCIQKDPTWYGCLFCLCCDIWLCALAWFLVVITTWVVETVCYVVTIAFWLLATVVISVVDIIIGLFTGDWSRLVHGLLSLGSAPLVAIVDLVPVITGGTLVGAFVEQSDRIRLHNYVRTRVNTRFGENPEIRERIPNAIGLNDGGFGLRLDARLFRLFVRSDTVSGDDGTSDLIVFNRELSALPGNMDLIHLAGFDPPFSKWERRRTVITGLDGNDVMQAEVQKYIDQEGRGPDIRHFIIYAMSTTDLDVRRDAATIHAREIGLELRWTVTDERAENAGQVVIDEERDNMHPGRFPQILEESPFNRHSFVKNPDVAREELGSPLFIATFAFLNTHRGISATMAGSACGLRVSSITGGAFKSWWPDILAKYTLVHELGHTFGLCHVDGVTRIMYAYDKDWVSVPSVWQYWTSGLEAGFNLEEAKEVWDYILENFSAERLATRAF